VFNQGFRTETIYGEGSTVHVLLPLSLDEAVGIDEFYSKG
jgi:hypothetical protein